ncbi:hypothetical protein HZB78_04640 [Candidatus Collierbacteria bacterium]|nr:hypothetical protein [Candidatus Collierbacteria bacterium]
MHAFLICGQNQNRVGEGIENLLRSRSGKIAPESRIDLRPSAKKDNKLPTLTIEDVRFISNWFSRQSSESRAVIIHQAQCLTVPAQQAILKILEEPFPDSSLLTINDSRLTIILTADSETSLLPTIRSRCKIIRLPALPAESSTAHVDSISYSSGNLHRLTETGNKSPSEKLIILYDLLSEFSGKKVSPYQGSIPRPDALKFMENIIDSLHSSLIHKSLFINHKSITICLQSACLSHRRLKNNLNVQLALQQFILDIPPISR